MRALGLVSLLLLVVPAHSRTQESAPLQPGQRVRVTAPSRGIDRYKDVFRQVQGDTLVLDAKWVPLSDVTRLESSAGERSLLGRGLWIGALAGLGFGIGLAAVAYPACSGESHDTEICTIWWMAAPPGGAVLGMLVGAFVGATSRTEGWSDVPLDRVRVSVGPRQGGRVALGVSLSF